MKFSGTIWFCYLILFIVLGCGQNDLFIPSPAKLENTNPILRSTLKAMDGIYKLTTGTNGLGETFVCKTSLNKVSFFSNKRGIFFIMDAGLDPTDSSIHLAGFWRVSENTSSGAISFTIPKGQGAKALLKNFDPSSILMTGDFTSSEGTHTVSIGYDRDFSPAVKAKKFAIFGHHGIMTNANPPFTENSLNAFRQAQDYGANSLEVDVRLTKDNIPVLLHDADISIRVAQKNGVFADLDQLNFSTLENFVRLIDGQHIPKVEDVLRVAVDSTELEYVWLDIKGNPDVFKYLEPVVRTAIANAKAKSRDIVIITDIPSTSVLQEYYKQPSYIGVPLMYEPELQTAIALGAGYWGPRWTLGTVNADVAKAHSLGMKVFTWTTNSEGIIASYLKDGDFDGMITDYPAFVVYHLYTK